MRIRETCPCGSSVDIEGEDDNTGSITKHVNVWRKYHRCWTTTPSETAEGSISEAEDVETPILGEPVDA